MITMSIHYLLSSLEHIYSSNPLKANKLIDVFITECLKKYLTKVAEKRIDEVKIWFIFINLISPQRKDTYL
jgi:hypothetical protein